MPTYEVIFTQGPNSAMDDLSDLDPTIQVVVLERSRQVLRRDLDPSDEDEQQLRRPANFKMRRAITRDDALRLRNTLDLEPTDSIQAHDVWYVYRDFSVAEMQEHRGQDGFVVERLLKTSQLAFLLLRI